MPEENKRKQRRISLIVTLVINLAIVAYIAITEFSKESAAIEKVSVHDIRLIYLLLGVACFFAAAFMDYSKYRRMLMVAEGKDDRRGALECSLLGKYYDNVTPFGAGGQPFQIHYLKRRGYTAGTSGATPIVSFLTQQIAFVLIAAVVFITNRDVLDSILLIRITAYVGLGMYALLPVCLLLFAAFPKPFKAVLRWAIRLLAKLHLVKDREKLEHATTAALDDYLKCLRLFRSRPIFFAKLIALSCLYQLAILSIPFFMLRAFGGSGSWWMTFSLVVYIYAAITIIPTPGNAGAAEGSFYAVFSSLEGGMLFWAMIAWRLLVYYSWLLCGILVLARSTVTRQHDVKKPPKTEGPLRVALINDIFYPSVDGVVRTVDAYARNLLDMGHDAFVFFPRQQGAMDYSELPYRCYAVPSLHVPRIAANIPLGRASKELRKVFETDPPDVLHVHSPFFTGRLALRLGKKYHIPVYATFHSKYYDDAYNVTHSKLLAKIMVNYVVDFYAKADCVWACSASTAQTLRSYGYNGVIHVMENGVDLAEAPQDLDALRRAAVEQFSLPADRPLLLFVGQLIWQKNLRLVLNTMKRLKDAGEPYYLVVAGEGYHGDVIQSYCGELSLNDCVRFLGKVTDRQLLFGLYAASGLMFFPSIYDNAPLVLREAAVTGLPSLLAAGSNAAEIVEDGVNGYTAEPNAEAMANRIREIFADPAQRAAVGQCAKQTIPISWKQIVARVVTAYRTGSKEGHLYALDIPKVE